MTAEPPKATISPARNIASILLFVVAGILLAVAAYLFIEDRRNEEPPTLPPSEPGHAELADVQRAFVSVGIDVEYGRESANADALDPVGQQLITDGISTFVFIYASPEDRQADTESLDVADIELVDEFGDPVATEPLSLAEGSNIVTISAGADDGLTADIAGAVALIP
jgi:hypothetical protein